MEDASSGEETVPEERVDSSFQKESTGAPTFIQTAGTFESQGTDDSRDTHDSGGNSIVDHVIMVSPINEDSSTDEELGCSSVEVSATTVKVTLKETVQEGHFGRAVYIAAFSFLGTMIRMYMERFFGLDCERGEDAVNDFITPLSRHICITSSGQTNRNGGSVFTVLPANMLGSFVMGILSPVVVSDHKIPWFQKDHPIQNHLAFHDGLKLGLCGCLTTFASWNTQMIIMLDGTQPEHGSQIESALFGYLLGMVCSAACFVVGRHVNEWLVALHFDVNGEGNETARQVKTREARESSGRAHQKSVSTGFWALFGVNFGPFVLVLSLIAACVVADKNQKIPFYRQLWITALASPCGSLLRWRLSRNKYPKLKSHLNWLPWGTFLANIGASVVSAALAAVSFRYLSKDDGWSLPISGALSAGFAGSLSTVSTMMREIFDRKTRLQSYMYWTSTIVCAMGLGLAFYSPIARF